MAQEIVIVTLVDNEQRDLRIEMTEAADLLVLLRHESLLEDGQFYEESLRGQEKIGTKAARGYTFVAPRERKLHRLVDPLVAVERE